MALLLLSVEISFSGILEWHGKRKWKQEYCVNFFQSYGNILIGILKCADTVAVQIHAEGVALLYISIPYRVVSTSKA